VGHPSVGLAASPFSTHATPARYTASAFDAIAMPAAVTATAFGVDETPCSLTATPGRVAATPFWGAEMADVGLAGVSEAQADEAEGLAGEAEDVPGVAVAGAGGF